MITEFQQKILDSTYDEIDMEIAGLLARLQDISNATDRNYTVIITPDKKPVLITDGEISDTFSYEAPDIPGFEDTQKLLKAL